MPDVKGDKLFVNLGASQVRRRLKGFGHGVRKVESAGRNQAVIVHTATGRHLDELASKFADVGCSARADQLSEPIENLRNLGPASCAWLRDVGIQTVSDLKRVGAAGALRMVQRRHRQASLNLLWAMAAGLKDIDWRELDAEEKDRLRQQLVDLHVD